ncbi:MAG: hypothetical protein ABII82_08060 [Verrucomicrobiota bacterium]
MQLGSADSSLLDYARIPPRLKDLLRREACLISSHQQVDAALREFHHHQQEVESTRPPFMFLQRKAVREQFTRKLVETTQTVQTLEQGLAKIDLLLPRLHEWIVEEIERHLSGENSAYLHGLARDRFVGDWNRLADRFQQHCTTFSGISDQLHGAVCALERDQRIAGQLHIIDLVKLARVHGARIDADLQFFTQIGNRQRADGHKQPLPEPAILRCETNVARIAMIDDINSRDLLARFITRFKQVSADFLPALRQQGMKAAVHAAGGDIPSYIDAAWDLLRARAINEFNPAHLEQTLIETERMLERHDQA